MKKPILLAAGTLLALTIGCFNQEKQETSAPPSSPPSSASLAQFGPEKLSEYAFFTGELKNLEPAEGILPYDLNTPLFSDYAYKERFVKIPIGKAAIYKANEVFDFPDSTVLIKNFYYPNDFRDESKGQRIIETRLLIKESGGWKALPYIWNDEQTEAYLEIAGGKTIAKWVYDDGMEKSTNYVIPNMNQCKGCHVTGKDFTPIGPSARQLNKTFSYKDGKENQLKKWKAAGILSGLPENENEWQQLVVWDDPSSGSLNDRARAYLEINCAHCHNPAGPGNTSGLFLEVFHKEDAHLGIYKSPVAAGRGSGGLSYDIFPGHPEKSIFIYRMNSTDPGVMMPELGRTLIHDEGVKLISEWIAAMKDNQGS